TGNTGNRSAGSHADDNVRDLAVCLLPDLGTGGVVVSAGIGGILVLIRENAVWNFTAESKRHRVVTARIVMIHLRGRHNDLGAESAQRVDLFLAHLVGHRKDALIAFD